MLDDLELLEALAKGSFWMKMKKFRALGLIKGRFGYRLEVTPEGLKEVERLKKVKP